MWFAKAAAQAGHRIPIVQFGFAERSPGSTLRCLRWAFIRRSDVEATDILRVPSMPLNLTMIAQDGTAAAAWNAVEERVVGERTARVVVMRNGVSWIPVPEYWITPERLTQLERKP